MEQRRLLSRLDGRSILMKKVLVLEDEASIRGFIDINLRRAGYDVVEAASGEEALSVSATVTAPLEWA